MSRIVSPLLSIYGALFALPSIACAQITAEDAIAKAKEVYGPPPPDDQKPRCPQQTITNEIIVCKELEEQSQFRVQSTADLDPHSQEALDDGMVHAPNVAAASLTAYGQASMRGCGIQRCPAPPVYMIDFQSLPEPPEGSDADLIAKGRKPAD
ncbi:hypothetical protein D6851_10410 [Altericroceibacterium spongiae]|uniref:Uncharacterized protein n=1 Tax=Altericroceibacterium spongiae TaxID=2320269 RepID=A0A420EIK5_9SPHN|nr:hypothetical protein D6851_10410 [Altericroceibacterium spongiae]